MKDLTILLEAMPRILSAIRGSGQKGTALLRLSSNSTVVGHMLKARIAAGEMALPETPEGKPSPLGLRALNRALNELDAAPASPGPSDDSVPGWIASMKNSPAQVVAHRKALISDILNRDVLTTDGLTVLLNGHGTGAVEALYRDIEDMSDDDLARAILDLGALPPAGSPAAFRDYLTEDNAVYHCGVSLHPIAKIWSAAEQMVEPGTHIEPVIHTTVKNPSGQMILTDNITMPSIMKEFDRVLQMAAIDLNSPQDQLGVSSYAKELFGGFYVGAGDTGPRVLLRNGLVTAVDLVDLSSVHEEIAEGMRSAGLEEALIQCWQAPFLDGLDPYDCMDEDFYDNWVQIHEELVEGAVGMPIFCQTTDRWSLMGAPVDGLLNCAQNILMRDKGMNAGEARSAAFKELTEMLSDENCRTLTMPVGDLHLYRQNIMAPEAANKADQIFWEHGFASASSELNYFILTATPLALEPDLVWELDEIVWPEQDPEPEF